MTSTYFNVYTKERQKQKTKHFNMANNHYLEQKYG